MNDFKFSLRQLRKTPGFTAVVVVSLALGIGASTAIFSVVNAVLLRSLPVPDPQHLRILQWTGVDARMRSISGYFDTKGSRVVAECVAPSLFERIRTRGSDLADIFAYAPLDDVVIRARHEAFAGNGMIVSDNFFSALGVQPRLGRLFSPAIKEADDSQQVVITEEWWEKHFSGDAVVVGQSLQLNASSFTVIGVLPRGFPGVRPGQPRGFYVLLTPQSRFLERAVSVTDHWWLRQMARVRPGVTDARLKAALDVVFVPEAATQMKEPGVLVQPGRGGLAFDRQAYQTPLMLMLGAVGLVMLVACANVAGLSLARGVARRHELSVRAALGAGRGTLIRQSLTESAILTVAGAALGVLLAVWGRKIISQLLAGSPAGLSHDLSLDLPVLSFTLGAALLTAVFSGLLPALRAGATDPLGGLKARTALGAPRLRSGRVLVVAQISVSLLLLAGAAWFVRSLANLRSIDAGFNTDNLLVFQVNPVSAGYQDARVSAFYEQVQSAVAAVPGARAASLVVFPLLDNKSSSGGFAIGGRSEQLNTQQTFRLVVGETFLDTLGIPLLEGRNLSSADSETASRVIVINQTFARKYFPNENPIGQTIQTWRSDWRIVGICRDSKYQSIKEAIPPTIYIPFRQFPLRYGAYFMVRTVLPPESLMTAVRKAIAGIDAAVPVARLATQEQLINATISQERLSATLGTVLSAFALLLSCIGLYGLMAYNVTRRSGEIAVRIALGAPPGRVAGSILKESLALTAMGIALGLPAVFAVARLLRGQIYGLSSSDPWALLAVVGALILVALMAAWLPARRAARVDPMEALRNE